MNYFDIRKLQSTLAMLRVAFLEANITNNPELQAALSDVPSLVLTLQQLSSKGELKGELTPTVASPFASKLTLLTDAIKEAVTRASETLEAGKANVLLAADVKKLFVDTIGSTLFASKILSSAQIKDVETIADDVIGVLFKGLSFISTIKETEVAALDPEKVDGSIKWSVPFSEQQVVQFPGIPLDGEIHVGTIVLDDVYAIQRDALHTECNPIIEGLRFKDIASRLGVAMGLDPARIAVKPLGLDKIFTKLCTAITVYFKLLLSAKVSAIVKVFNEANFSGSVDIDTSIKDVPALALTAGILSEVGVKNIFTVAGRLGETDEIKVNSINLSDLIKTIGASYGVTQEFNSALEMSLAIIANADMDTKDIAKFEVEDIFASGTICVILDKQQSAAAAILLKSAFGANARVSLGASAKTEFDEAVNVDVATQMMAGTSAHLPLKENIRLDIKAVVGYDLIKLLQDYNAKNLSEMMPISLDDLCIERIN